MEQAVATTRREQILHEAGFLFREKGYKSTSMKDIALRVNMEAASLYNHIKSKHEILSELLLDIADRFRRGMQDIDAADHAPLEKIRALITLHIRLTTGNTHAIGLLNQDWRHLKDPQLTEFVTIRQAYADRFLAIIRESMERGEIRPAHPEIVLNTVFSSVGWLYGWYKADKHVSPAELEAQITNLLVDGMKV